MLQELLRECWERSRVPTKHYPNALEFLGKHFYHLRSKLNFVSGTMFFAGGGGKQGNKDTKHNVPSLPKALILM